MIKLRRGRMPCCRHISLLVCLVMVSGLLLSFSPLPAGADAGNLATTLNTLYGGVTTGMGTISAVYTAAGGLQVTDFSQSPWTQVFASGTGLDVSKLVSNGKYANADAAKLAVASLLRDFAELVYYGGSGAQYNTTVLNNFWNLDGVTIQNIVGSSVTEDDFSSYMSATITDLPTEVVALSTSGTLTAIQNGTSNLNDPAIDQLMNDSFANALNNTAKNSYPLFNQNAGGANWDFGSIINNGFIFVDGAIDPNSLGEIYLMVAIPSIITTPTSTGNSNGNPLQPSAVPPPVPPPAVSPGVFVARWPGNVDLGQMFLIPSPVSGSVPTSFVVTAPDQSKLAAAKAQGLEQRVYYFNEKYQKWVALASYPQSDGSVLVENDGGYSNDWTEMYAVQEPHYTDITGYWAEDVMNRMNGLALLEGYPIPGDQNPLERTAGPDRSITRAEFATILARALGDLPTAEQKLYGVLLPNTEEPTQVLAGWSGVPDWSRDFVAGMVYSGLVQGEASGDFAGNTPITRIEAAVMVSKVLSKLPNYKPADLSKFADATDVPDWAKGGVAGGVLSGYQNGTLQPNNPITRAEALVTILKLLRALGW